MQTFKYTIIENGKKVTDTVDAVDINSASAVLRSRGVVIIGLELSKRTNPASDKGEVAFSKKQKLISKLLINSSHLEQAFEQLSVMLEEGVSIINALTILKKTASPRISRAMGAVADSIEKGSSVGEAIERNMPFIDPITLALIKVGESNGSLPQMLSFASKLLSQKREIKALIIEALIYPVFILFATACVGLFISNYVLPKIINFISTRSATLPLPTQILVNINQFSLDYGLYIVFLAIVSLITFIYLYTSPKYGVHISRLILKIPYIGKAIICYSNSLWCNTLGVLIQSGINIIHSLALTEKTVQNKFFIQQFNNIRRQINDGRALGSSFMSTHINDLAPIACSMIVVGENSGSLDRGLIHAAEYNQKELTKRVNMMGRLIEPAMLLIVGGIVAFVYIAFFMAIQSATLSVH